MAEEDGSRAQQQNEIINEQQGKREYLAGRAQLGLISGQLLFASKVTIVAAFRIQSAFATYVDWERFCAGLFEATEEILGVATCYFHPMDREVCATITVWRKPNFCPRNRFTTPL
jgi:hypothetical protein